MFRSGDRLCDTLQWKNALCVRENFCEDRLHNRILSQQEVALIQSDLILCNLLWQQNPDAEIKIFTKILLYTTPGGGTWVFFGWVCAAWDSKLAPRSKKNSPKIDTPF